MFPLPNEIGSKFDGKWLLFSSKEEGKEEEEKGEGEGEGKEEKSSRIRNLLFEENFLKS